MLRPGMLDSCRNIPGSTEGSSSMLCDIYDGKMWKKFLNVEGKPFCPVQELNLALQLNVDWFKPFTHTLYSNGGICLTILNLEVSGIKWKTPS